MTSRVLFLSALCLLCSCWGDESSTQSAVNIPIELVDSSEDLERDTSVWQNWKPWNMFKWGHQHSLFNNLLTHSSRFWESDNGRHHIHHDRIGNDSQRTLTRRESSLITEKATSEGYDTGRTRSTTKFQSESITSLVSRPPRPHGSVRRELITSMFETMLDNIVESWDAIPSPVKQEPEDLADAKTSSEQTFASKKTKKSAQGTTSPSGKSSRTKRNRSSKLELLETQGPPYQCWWSSPDERAIIRFKNGNVYEGDISMKWMHGEGRFQWADGTVYLGQFKNNQMHGKGMIQWKDDTWYQGDVMANVRHGRGLYVDSRKQAFYTGGWHRGTKHGEGLLHYPSTETNSYDGDWEYVAVYVRNNLESYNTRGERHSRNMRNADKLDVIPNSLTRSRKLTHIMGPEVYNTLPKIIISAPSFGSFKNRLKC